jgi:hypothetical protein
MKSSIKFLGIIALVAVIGFLMSACDNEPPGPPPPPPPQPGDSVNNPIERYSDTNLGTMTSPASGWRQLLNSIESVGKYVNLDLSACTMTGTSFNPDATVETGKKYIVSIILPTVATSIEAGAYSDPVFKNFTNLKSISGENIITIGDYSFVYRLSSSNGPRSLQSVNFPSATTIGESAFSDTYLESVNFPSVTTIGESAFSNCRWLKNASFPAVQSIGESAFYGCSYLESVSFPALAELGFSSGNYSNPFTSCDKLTFTLTGTGSLSVIEDGKALVRNNTILLAYPSASGTVTMNNITSLDGRAFSGCYYLNSVNFPQATSIGSGTFSGCGLQSINFPLVISIGSNAFSGCRDLQDVNFPQVTVIDTYVFNNCNRLQSASFPLIETIGSYAFFGCSNLVTFNIPNVTNIEQRALSYTGDATLSITMGSTAPTLGREIFFSGYGDSNIVRTVRLKIPSGATGYNPASSPFSGISVTVNSGTTANWANGFRGGGWNGYTWNTGSSYITDGTTYINQNISLIIEQQ